MDESHWKHPSALSKTAGRHPLQAKGLDHMSGSAAKPVLLHPRGPEQVITRLLQLPAEPGKVEAEQLSPPLADRPGDHHRIDIAPVHEGHDRTRDLAERRHVEGGGIAGFEVRTDACDLLAFDKDIG